MSIVSPNQLINVTLRAFLAHLAVTTHHHPPDAGSAHPRRPGPPLAHPQQSADLYELIMGRHRVSSFIITSNRAVDEWLSLFDDPILGNNSLDRLANANYQIVIERASYREKLSPHRKLLGDREGDSPLN